MKDLNADQKFAYPSVKRKVTGGARFQEGDTLFARITPCLENGKICQARGLEEGIGFGSTEFLVFRGKENVSDTDFVYYLSRWDVVRRFAEQHMVGTSGRQRVPKEAFDNLILDLPDIRTQQHIASILSSLDSKIELNRRMNQTLEQIAATLFKKHFVDDIDSDNLPDGWSYKKVSDVFDISIGRTPPRKEFHWFTTSNADIKWVSIKDMGNSGVFILNSSEYLTQEAVKRFNVPKIPTNTVLLSFKLTVGRVSITTEEMLSNEAIAHFLPKSPIFAKPYFCYLYLKSFDYDSLGNTSSIATAVNSQTIKDMRILVPAKSTVEKFTRVVEPVFEKIKINLKEADTLAQTRDILLPKLMSGEINISIPQSNQSHEEVLS